MLFYSLRLVLILKVYNINDKNLLNKIRISEDVKTDGDWFKTSGSARQVIWKSNSTFLWICWKEVFRVFYHCQGHNKKWMTTVLINFRSSYSLKHLLTTYRTVWMHINKSKSCVPFTRKCINYSNSWKSSDNLGGRLTEAHTVVLLTPVSS